MEDIIISKDESNNYFVVKQGDKSSDCLGFDEMLGLITAITMPEVRPYLHWLKPKITFE